MSSFKVTGHYKVDLVRNGKVIQTEKGNNSIVNEGLDEILDVMFNNSAQVDPWFVGLIDDGTTPVLADGDTMSANAWDEEAAYDEAVRQSWAPGAASAQSVTNGTQMTFTMNATDAVHGIFVCTISTKSTTTGTLWATAAFASVINVVATDELKVTYTVTAARG